MLGAFGCDVLVAATHGADMGVPALVGGVWACTSIPTVAGVAKLPGAATARASA